MRELLTDECGRRGFHHATNVLDLDRANIPIRVKTERKEG